ncbi:hypothetical protein Tco_1336239 [Tanacetum coccineum]
MSTLTHDVLTAGSDNRSPMPEKSSYDSWQKTRRLEEQKKRECRPDLTVDEKKQMECDIKATNIILQGLPNNIYTLHSFEQHENCQFNLIRAERAIRNHDLLALVANTYNPPSTYNNPPPQSNQVLYPPQHSYAAPVVQQQAIETPKSHDSRLAIPTVTIQNVQGRQTKSYGNNGKGKVAGMDAIKTVGDYAGANAVKVIKCYNCKGTRHYAKQYCEEELNTTSLFMADCVDAFDSYCNEDATSEILMAKISHARRVTNNNVGPSYDTDALS